MFQRFLKGGGALVALVLSVLDQAVIHSKYAKSRGCLLSQRFVVWLLIRSDSVDFRRVNKWQASHGTTCPKRTVDDVIIENGPGKGTEYFRNEYGVPFPRTLQTPFLWN